MKNLLYLILTLVVATAAIDVNGQTQTTRQASVSGIVIDGADNQPMIGATVIIKGTTKGDITNEKGAFNITGLARGKETTLVVNYLGYKTFEFLYNPIASKNVMNESIKLMPDNLNIDEVVVVGSAPVATQMGDTTQYNSGAFKTNPDATAEDLVAKMPGFSVSDGKIQAQGEDITRVYVDGKSYFKNDPTTALNSLPADAIESIQLFDEKSDKTKFTGVDDGNRTKTINIVTKAKKNSVRMGDFIGGYGTGDTYNVKGNLNIFEGDHRFNIGFGANNINQSALSGSRFYGRSGRSGIQDAAGFKFNYSGEYKKDETHKTDLGFNYTFNRNLNRTESSKVQQSILTSEKYEEINMNNALSMRHNFNLDIESTLGDNKIFFRPYASIQDNGSNVNSSTSRSMDNIFTNKATTSTNKGGNSYDVGGSLSWMHKFSDKHSISLGTDMSFSENNSDQYLRGNSAQMNYDINELVDSLINQKSIIYSGTNSVNGSLSYTYGLKENQGITLEYQVGYDWSTSDNKTYLFNPITGLYDDIYLNLSNVFNRDYLTNEAGIGYSINKKDKINFSVKANYQYASLENQLVFPENKMFDYGFNSVVANMRLEYYINKNKRITAFYNGRPRLPSVTQLQDVLDNSNPLRVSKGNPLLDQSYNNMFALSYSASNVQKSTTFRAFSFINNSINSFATNTVDIKQDTTINGVPVQRGAKLLTPVNINGQWSVRAGFDYSFPLNFIKSKMNTGMFYSYNRQPSVYNDELDFINNNTANLNLMINSNISQNIDFSVGNSLSYTFSNSTKEGAKSNNYLNERVSVRFNWIFLKSFVFNTDYSYNYNFYSENSPEDPQFHMLNAGLGYKFLNNNAEFRISAYDLLNQSKSFGHTVDDIYVTDTVSRVLQRYFMLTFSFKFNNMKGNASASQTSGSSGMRGPGGMGGGGMRMMH